MSKRLVLTVALVSALVPFGGRAAERSLADAWRQKVAEVAHQAGVDPAEVLGADLALRIPGPDRVPVLRHATLEQWLELVGGVRMDAGIAGLPEVTAGDFLHLYANVGLGIDPSYNVTTSSVVPATPAVYPPAPASLLIWDAGGPLTQVKGGGYLEGAHSVGTFAGSNVDTGAGGPYLPVANTDLVFDTSIDFIGHVEVLDQAGVCPLGVCLAWVGVLLADGVSIWDTADPSLPIIP